MRPVRKPFYSRRENADVSRSARVWLVLAGSIPDATGCEEEPGTHRQRHMFRPRPKKSGPIIGQRTQQDRQRSASV